MADQAYSKRELDQYHKTIEEKLEDLKSTLEEVLAQTTKTNGRVNSLENWKSMLIGMAIISNIFVVPVLLKLFL
jgi:hypothetical protein